MHLLTTRVEFCAANRLRNPNLSEEENRELFGACAENHGHNYILEVHLASRTLDPKKGMVADFYDIWGILRKEIVDKVDHKDLSKVDILQGVITTSEGIVKRFFEILAPRFPDGMLREVRLYESTHSWTAFRKDD